jgi:23S rRNA (cytidine1920-2'-O)/16S rRNA (cytidine1409-2'-O)-methyltransferase
MKTARRRIDVLMVERGLAASREKAQAILLAGSVFVNGQRVDKPGTPVAEDAPIEVKEGLKFSSRGGLKLERALEHFHIDVTGRTCLDIGSSTGGFTDCLLQRGAARVHAVDVGTGQLDWKLRTDPRVVVHEGLNARNLRLEDIGEKAGMAVCDVSFISVTLILPALPPLLCEPGEIIVLVKPQFEVGRQQVGKGGIVRDPALHEDACRKVSGAASALGFACEIIESPILGAEGNREFLLYGRDPMRRHHLEA